MFFESIFNLILFCVTGIYCTLSSYKPCDWNSVWRAAHIIKAYFVGEVDGFWLSTMFSTYSHLEVGFDGTPFLNSNFHQLANAFLIKDFKRIVLNDTCFLIDWHEFGYIVTAESECCLGQVVCSKREEVGFRLLSYLQ